MIKHNFAVEIKKTLKWCDFVPVVRSGMLSGHDLIKLLLLQQVRTLYTQIFNDVSFDFLQYLAAHESVIATFVVLFLLEYRNIYNLIQNEIVIIFYTFFFVINEKSGHIFILNVKMVVLQKLLLVILLLLSMVTNEFTFPKI